MKPILVSDHENEALAFIQAIESDYISLVGSVVSEIRALGLEPTEAIVRAVLTDGAEVLEGKYRSYSEKDVPRDSTPAIKVQMRILHEHAFAEFLKGLAPLFERTIGGKSVKHPMFQDLIAFDALTPYLPAEGKEKILAQFREYISDPRILKLRNACAEAAAGMQNFWVALVKSGVATGFMIDHSASEMPGWMFERQVFYALSSFLTISGENGKYAIEAKAMDYTNFEPEIIKDHEE